MSHTEDRPDADIDIETSAIESVTTEEAAEAAGPEAKAIEEVVAEAPEAEPFEAAAPSPEDVVATAVLVVEPEEAPAEVALAGDDATELSSDMEYVALPAIEDDLSDPDTVEDLDLPLLDDEIEHGIAEVFAALQAAAERGEMNGDGDEPDDFADEGSDDDLPDEAIDVITYQLLGELDRLWHRAA